VIAENAIERPRRRIEIGRNLHRGDPDDLFLGICFSPSGPPLAVDVAARGQVWSMKRSLRWIM